jgi:hypothetical protein
VKKKIVCLLVFLCCYGICTAQQVVSAGGYAVKSEVSVNWILGGNISGIPVTDLSTLPKTGTDESTESLVALKVYPNPTSDFLNIEITPVDTGRLILELINSSGGKSLSKVVDNQPILQVNVSEIPAGVYLLRVYIPYKEQLFKVEKVIKK